MKEKEERLKWYAGVKKIDVRTFAMFAVLVILWVLFTYFTSEKFSSLETSFLSTRNLSNLMRQMTTVGVMGIGMVLVIVSGGIDLSAGAVVGFIGCVAAYLQVYQEMGTTQTIIICLTVSVIIYIIQGSLISYLELAPFIVTLGGMLIFKGLILLVTRGATIAPLQQSMLYFGQAYISKPLSLAIGIAFSVILLLNGLQKRASKRRNGTLNEDIKGMIVKWVLMSAALVFAVLIMNNYRGMPVPVLIMFLLVGVLTVIAERTTFGRSIYAIGGNLDAAKYSGINVKKNLVMVYALHGLMIGVAGIVLAARLNASTTTAANMSLELDAIAAAVIGGTSMTGGIGKVAGAIIGGLIMATIDNGMSMMNLDASWQYIVKGTILVAAVWFDIRTNKKRKS
ncbi:MAG TPA: sugar ABC transporter permease [Anaerovoracaceae bacterium]|nr:sugar ABC transporter permease [Anaerovoracaceae bacterium]